jgi:hypothetical protein
MEANYFNNGYSGFLMLLISEESPQGAGLEIEPKTYSNTVHTVL